jgi:predicted DNA-binding protein (UPF0251 family)
MAHKEFELYPVEAMNSGQDQDEIILELPPSEALLLKLKREFLEDALGRTMGISLYTFSKAEDCTRKPTLLSLRKDKKEKNSILEHQDDLEDVIGLCLEIFLYVPHL